MRCLTVVLLCLCGISLGAHAPAQVTSAQAQIAAAEKAAASLPGVTANTPPRKCYILKPEQIVLPGYSDNPASFDLSSGDFAAGSISFGWDKAYELGRAMATAAAYGLLGKEAPPFVVAPALTVTKANVAEGWMESLHREAPKTVLDATK